jgi:hypothetical protein
LFGDVLLVDRGQADTPADSRAVRYFDLPVEVSRTQPPSPVPAR